VSAAVNPGNLARHDLVRVAPASWPAILAECSPLPDEPLLADWAERDRPLVVRRTRCDERRCASLVPLGVSLPPSCKMRRIALQVPAIAISRVSPPPLLAELVSSAPLAWRPTIDRLLELDAGTRAYGSLAWQHATGLGYLSATSDLDLLWRCAAGSSCETLLAGIAAIERHAPMRIDGEVLAADGGAVHWRELQSGAAEVLVKRRDDVVVVSRRAFISGSLS
jgi:malonate decarboxylase holo-[acyl-carrier-protein] synthase